MTSRSVLAGFLALTSLLPFCAAQATCRGRCGESFSRGQVCYCDYDCLFHKECCTDFESTCTTSGSCMGRCGEPFKRGRQCDCDSDCILYGQCCPDYQTQCDAAESAAGTKLTNSQKDASKNKAQDHFLSEFAFSCSPTQQTEVTETLTSPIEGLGIPLSPQSTAGHEALRIVVQEALPSHDGATRESDITAPVLPTALQPISVTAGDTDYQVAPYDPGMDHFGADATSEKPTTSLEFIVSTSNLAGSSSRPSTLTDATEVLESGNPDDYLANNSNETDLCNGQPINGVTVLLNGTIVVFRGHFCWTLDENWTPSPARTISDVWGVPSPIDAVFTRSNCQGKTYILKGNNYWRFENGVMEPGYPKTISVEFNGLSGKITGALSVPATRKRPESVYFFKKGGLVQRYSYELRSMPTCGKKSRVSSNEKQPTGEAEINIRLKWKGFPTSVTSAASIPNPRKSEGYDYFIFTDDKYYNVKVVGERLALAPPPARNAKSSGHHWLRCQ